MTDAQVTSALARARPVPYWLDQPAAPPPEAQRPLAGRATAELAVIGGGFTGLWTALQAKEADPDRDVVLLEARRVAWAGPGGTAASARPVSRMVSATARTGSLVSLPPSSASAAAIWTRSRRRSHVTGLTATSPEPASWPSRRSRGRPTACARLPRLPPGSAPPRGCSMPMLSGPRSTRPPTWLGYGTPTAVPPSTRPGSPGGCGRRVSRPAF